jgi:hypothetical protein
MLLPSGSVERSRSSFLVVYLAGAAVRFLILVSALWITVFLLHVNPLGVLAGSFIGIMGITFIALFKMKANISLSKKT